ncbi:MAG: trigger factor [Desulfotomaculaceae bacterium]|nr:trigger factor [Desulfotomaculaceae bacterium]MDD4766485.1 trigger factor [Desulfotomaculaceae bacterium]
MKANAERIEKNTVQLEIELEAEQFDQAIDKAYRRLVQRYNVPGFRKGKTPKQVFERYVGKEIIVEEAIEIVLPEAYYKAVVETGIEPVDQPQMDIVQAEEGKPALFKATVLVKPEVVLGQYKEIEVVRPSADVPEEEIDKTMDSLRQKHAKIVTMEEGVVKKGDTAVIDFVGKIDGEPFKGGDGNEFPLEIGSGSFIAGFEEQLIDVLVGETTDVKATFPEDYRAEDLAGKEAVFTVTVKAIRRKELSDLDDEFAKDVSEFDTLEELRTDMRNKLEEAAQDRAKFQIRQEVVSKIVDSIELEMPEPMVQSQLDDMIRNLESRIRSQGATMENYLMYANTTMEELREKMHPDAIWSAKMNLVMEAIAKVEDIKATDEEIKAEATKIAGYYNAGEEEIQKLLDSNNQSNYLTDLVVREKTLEFLADNAKFIESATEPVSAEPAEPENKDTNEPETE